MNISGTESGLLARVRHLAAESSRWEREHPREAEEKRLRERDAYTRELLARQAEDGGRGAVLRRMQRIGVPRRVLDDLAGMQETPALAAARDYHAKGRHPFCVLTGEVGRGKTVAAGWLMARWLQGRPENSAPSGGNPPDEAMWAGVREFDGATDWKPEHVVWVERLCRARFLVLDELGAERAGENAPALGQIERVLSARHAAKLRTVVTCNLEKPAMAGRYDRRVWSRLQECADFRVATGPDLRLGSKP